MSGKTPRKKLSAYGDDESRILSLMLSVYGKDAAACDEMYEAEFAGYAQNIDFIEERKAGHLLQALAPILGLKMMPR